MTQDMIVAAYFPKVDCTREYDQPGKFAAAVPTCVTRHTDVRNSGTNIRDEL